MNAAGERVESCCVCFNSGCILAHIEMLDLLTEKYLLFTWVVDEQYRLLFGSSTF